jgi:hypothetical protein
MSDTSMRHQLSPPDSPRWTMVSLISVWITQPTFLLPQLGLLTAVPFVSFSPWVERDGLTLYTDQDHLKRLLPSRQFDYRGH